MMSIHIKAELQKRRSGDSDGRAESISEAKHETIITALCVNGHENVIRPEALHVAWYFKCAVCGTLYVQSSIASNREIKEG